MKRAYIIIITLSQLLTLFPTNAIAQSISIIINRNNPILHMTARQVSDIYLGRRKTFPTGDPVHAFERKSDAPLRQAFYQLLNGMDIKRVNAYWARLQFSGNVIPPPTIDDDMEVLEVIRKTPNAIGYINTTHLDESVKAVLLLKSY